MTRGKLALGEPAEPAVLRAEFPRATDPIREVWYRAHSDARVSEPDRGCWWFASFPPGEVGTGRFDLPEPAGTCYFADDIEAAVRETLGEGFGSRPYLPAGPLAGKTVSQVDLRPYTRGHDLADTDCKAAARFITRELASGAPYELAQRHATAFHQAGFHGILYRPRFTPGPVAAVALFNDSGGKPDPGRTASDVPDWLATLPVPVLRAVRRRRATVIL